MNVVQRVRAREFCTTMQDYIIDSDVTITFAVKYGGRLILEEEYVPDGDNLIHIRKLGQFCELALWGIWCAGDVSWQPDAAGTFTFLINNVEDTHSFVMFSRMQTKKDATTPGWLSEVNRKITRMGCKEYVSIVMEAGTEVIVTGTSTNSQTAKVQLLSAGADVVASTVTIDASLDKIEKMFAFDLERYEISYKNFVYEFIVDNSKYAIIRCFRFKNVYDMPETVSVVGGLSVSGGNESDTAAMYGIERKFGVKVNDEYTANSGVIMLQSDYKLWHNFLNAQEADILNDREWLPIVVTKQKYEREYLRSILKTVEFSFRLADPEQNNLIEV